MQDCDRIRMFISSYLEGDLSHEVHREVEAHLTTCNECHAVYVRTRLLCVRLKHLPRVKASANFEARLHKQISVLSSRNPSASWLPLQGWKTPLAASAAVLGSVALIMLFSQNPSNVDKRGYIEQSGIGTVNKPVPAAAAAPASVPKTATLKSGVRATDEARAAQDSLNPEQEIRQQRLQLVGDN